MQRLFDDNEKWSDAALEMGQKLGEFVRQIIAEYGDEYPLCEISYVLQSSVEGHVAVEILTRQMRKYKNAQAFARQRKNETSVHNQRTSEISAKRKKSL